jgi:hypothetical protein
MKDNGNKPNIKNKIPELIILNVNPLNILSNICPDNTLAANLNPKDTFLAKYEINSIKTKTGTKAKGQPAGTNNEKKTNLCFCNPKIVAPNTTVKLIENVKTK